MQRAWHVPVADTAAADVMATLSPYDRLRAPQPLGYRRAHMPATHHVSWLLTWPRAGVGALCGQDRWHQAFLLSSCGG